MDWNFNGLPLHILLVHFVVVAVPLAALCVVLTAAWPTARRRLGIVTPLVAGAALASVPLAIGAGQALEEHVSETALTNLHTHMGEDLQPWAIGLFAVAVAQWIWFHFFAGTGRYAKLITARPARLAITVALIAAAAVTVVGSSYSVYVVGESGARATWTPLVSTGGNGAGQDASDSDSH